MLTIDILLLMILILFWVVERFYPIFYLILPYIVVSLIFDLRRFINVNEESHE